MHVIEVEFVRHSEITLAEIVHATGVYVLWDGRACVRPSYIGEGDMLARVVTHRSWFARSVEALIGIVDSGSRIQSKRDSEIVEAALLSCAGQCSRYPTRNQQGGKGSRIDAVLRRHPTIRIKLFGQDPLLNPAAPAMCDGKVVTIRRDCCGNAELESVPWNARRLAA